MITALKKAISCTKREAVSYATTIDREGRCIVCCSNFKTCDKAKEVMTTKPTNRGIPKPLKVKVIILHTFIKGGPAPFTQVNSEKMTYAAPILQ